MTVGKTTEINPYTDCAIATSKAMGPLPIQKGNTWVNGEDAYLLSDYSAFAVSPVKHSGHVSYATTYYYYSYKLTPTKTGTFTFYQRLDWVEGKYGAGGTSHETDVTYNITVVDVTKITIPSTLSLKVGETYTFSPVITDSRATTTLTWNSSNTSVATIANGKLTAKAIGTTVITCTADNGVSARCTVTVNPILATSISLNQQALNLNIGSGSKLTATVLPANTTNKTVKWASTNSTVATVDQTGQVTGMAEGTAIISATTSDGSNLSTTCTVTVKPILVTSITLSQTALELTKDETATLQATVLPANATNSQITWNSSNTAVATVSQSGLVTPVGAGSCVVTVAAVDASNVSATCQVTVLGDLLYINDAVSVPSGQMTLPVYLKNQSSITGLQFELQLPEGVTVATNTNGQVLATVSERVADHTITGSKISNGNYQFVVFSPGSKALTGNEGAVAYVTLDIDDDMAIGEYQMTIKEIELTKTNGEASHHKDMTAMLKLTSVTMGDTNGDGKVTVTDAVGVVNHILERNPPVFIPKAADVNNDGSISISDAVSIINIILNQ